jgi:hypothetical protein
MMQNIFSLVLLGGTGIALLGRCIANANGFVVFPLAGIAVFFSVGFFAHLRSLRQG